MSKQVTNKKKRIAADPVTIIISRVVKPGCQEVFEVSLKGISEEVKKFAGYMGGNLIRPADGSKLEYVNIFRFDSYENMHAWEISEVRKKWLMKLDALVERESKPQVITGLEYWFTLPEKPLEKPPPRHKMAVLIWLAVFPILLVLPPAIRNLLHGFPDILVIAAISCAMVAIMTFIIMPLLTRCFARWLFK